MTNVISRLSETPGEIRHTGGATAPTPTRCSASSASTRAELAALREQGRRLSVPPLTWLYVPADRPDRVEKALASEAHAVIVDLEDGVAPAAKEAARANLPWLLDRPRGKTVVVRVNGLDSGLAERDLEAVAGLAGVDAIELPKVERPEDVARAVSLVPRELPLHCLIESAAALEAAYEIASAPGVGGISLGEADLRSQTGALERGSTGRAARIVNAAVAAGLPAHRSPSTRTSATSEGLARRAAGAVSSAISAAPRSTLASSPVIVAAYLPTPDELEQARATIERLEQTVAASALDDGAFVDAAMLGSARQVVAIWEAYGS